MTKDDFVKMSLDYIGPYATDYNKKVWAVKQIVVRKMKKEGYVRYCRKCSDELKRGTIYFLQLDLNNSKMNITITNYIYLYNGQLMGEEMINEQIIPAKIRDRKLRKLLKINI